MDAHKNDGVDAKEVCGGTVPTTTMMTMMMVMTMTMVMMTTMMMTMMVTMTMRARARAMVMVMVMVMTTIQNSPPPPAPHAMMRCQVCGDIAAAVTRAAGGSADDGRAAKATAEQSIQEVMEGNAMQIQM